MTDYRHVEYSLGFKVDAAETTIRMPGKRLWYAPWKRGPDVVIDMLDEMQRFKQDAENQMSATISRDLYSSYVKALKGLYRGH